MNMASRAGHSAGWVDLGLANECPTDAVEASADGVLNYTTLAPNDHSLRRHQFKLYKHHLILTSVEISSPKEYQQLDLTSFACGGGDLHQFIEE